MEIGMICEDLLIQTYNEQYSAVLRWLLLIIVISVDLNAEEPGRVEGQTGGIVAV